MYTTAQNNIVGIIGAGTMGAGIAQCAAAAGEEVVLFLTHESSIGLCAPVGLSQGKFAVVRKNQRASVRCPRGTRTLFQNADPASFRGLDRGELEAAFSSEEAVDLKNFLKLCSKVKE